MIICLYRSLYPGIPLFSTAKSAKLTIAICRKLNSLTLVYLFI